MGKFVAVEYTAGMRWDSWVQTHTRAGFLSSSLEFTQGSLKNKAKARETQKPCMGDPWVLSHCRHLPARLLLQDCLSKAPSKLDDPARTDILKKL